MVLLALQRVFVQENGEKERTETNDVGPRSLTDPDEARRGKWEWEVVCEC